MNDGRGHSLANLALSLIVLVMAVGVAVLGADEHDLLAEPDRDAAVRPKPPSGH
jgi:hypothetical protein